MNKIKYFIYSFICSIFTILLSLFCDFENFWYWLVFALIILSLPIFFYKILQSKKFSKEFWALFSQILIFCVVLAFAAKYILPNNDEYMVALTKSSQKANEIQELLTTENQKTIRQVLISNFDNSKNFLISVKSNKKDNYQVTLDLLNSKVFDDKVQLCANAKYTKNDRKMLKRYEREYENFLYNIDGLNWVHAEFVLADDFNITKKIKAINVDFKADKTADNKKIKRQVEKYISSVHRYSGIKVVVSDTTYIDEAIQIAQAAREFFKEKNYTESLKLFKKANNMCDNFNKSIEDISKVIELNKKIKNEPKNYRYYVELGDILNTIVPFSYMEDYSTAIENYDKALKLNPSAKEIYEKLSNAYSHLNKFYYDNKNLEYKNKSIENHLKAVEN